MDLPEKQNLSIDEIFEESVFANRLFLSNREHSEHLSEKDYLDFNIEESLNNFINIDQMPLPEPLQPDECHSVRDRQCFDDTNHLQDLEQQNVREGQACEPESALQKITILQEQSGVNLEQERMNEPLNYEKLEYKLSLSRQIIAYLVEHSNWARDDLNRTLSRRFGSFIRNQLVQDLVQKFTRLKKTKEELIKYCMRKAFKFILQLPKNKHLLQVNKQQKFSFSKCKNRFLKNISEEKSMNNKFLQQIFQEKDFSQDYELFLKHFEQIMQDDNDKKIKYLAELLTVNKEGKVKSVEMVRRLPWTKTILEKVAKISKELLKYSGQK